MEYHQKKYGKEYTATGYFSKYTAEIHHTGLKIKKILKDKDRNTLETKITSQFKSWDSKFEKEKGKIYAEAETKKAEENLDFLNGILIKTIDNNTIFSWESLQKKSVFDKKNPKKELKEKINNLKPVKKPKYIKTPVEPLLSDSEFTPKFNFFERLFKGLKKQKTAKLQAEFKKKHQEWVNYKATIIDKNKKQEIAYQKEIETQTKLKEDLIRKYEQLFSEWETEKKEFKRKINSFNSKISTRKQRYFNFNKTEVKYYNSMVIKDLNLPAYFPHRFEIDYIPENKILIIEYVLPSVENIPKIKEVRYISTKNEIKNMYLSESQINALYDKTIYNVILGIIHLVFKSDIANAIEAVNINGWVDTIDKRNGQKINSCIVSLQTTKTEFNEINLKNVDPKLCFRNLKGVGSSKLSSLVAIKPILTINKADKRFIESKDIDFEETTNLALMDWDDFEHLIRELFDKEFSANGGEVKVTQASRDGGVDAVAFDPDPIRGGKIIIQAKRYTNVVGVSAVRDLYGAVLNEGATKGILVTTAEYGADSYKFAKDKPLTLLNGSNLLHLLSKHGQKARIDIKEAKRIIKEQKK